MQILRIDSSTTGDQSISRKLTDELLAHFTAKHPEAKVVTRDLVAEPLPHIDPITTSAIRTPAWITINTTPSVRNRVGRYARLVMT